MKYNSITSRKDKEQPDQRNENDLYNNDDKKGQEGRKKT